MVVFDERALSFKHGDGHSGLLILVGGEGLRFLGWDDSSALNNWGHNTSNGLNSKRKGCHINEKNILSLLSSLSTKNTSLHSGSVCDGLIWVNTTVWFLSVEVFFEERLDLWDTGGSSD